MIMLKTEHIKGMIRILKQLETVLIQGLVR